MHRYGLMASVVLSILVSRIASTTIPENPAPSSATSSSSTITPVVPAQSIESYIPPVASPEASVTRIFSYNSGGFENLALRSNGQILATIAFPAPLHFYVDPLQIRPGVVLHNFTSLKNTVGIPELAPDTFYKVSTARGLTFKKIGSVPSALSLNGMTRLRRNDNFVFIADTLRGGIWKFSIDTGESTLLIQDPSMAGPANKSDFAAFGINGVGTQNGTLFYCNSGAQSFYKMLMSLLPLINHPSLPFNPFSGSMLTKNRISSYQLHQNNSPANNATLITTVIACDDFALDPCVASPRNAVLNWIPAPGRNSYPREASTKVPAISSARRVLASGFARRCM